MKAIPTTQSARNQTLAFLQSPGWPFRWLHLYLALPLPLPNRKSLEERKPTS